MPRQGFEVRQRRYLLAGVTAVSFIADVTTKAWARKAIPIDGIDLPGPLDLRLVLNSGVSFGIGSDLPIWLVLAVTAAATSLVAMMFWRRPDVPLAGGLIVGGAISNLADRTSGGAVVDLFSLGWFPTFNLADVFITTGVAALILIRPSSGNAIGDSLESKAKAISG